MPRTTQLIHNLEHEQRILDHCDRVDRELPLYADEDRMKARTDSTGRAYCRTCKTAPVSGWGCSLCWRCRAAASGHSRTIRLEKVG